jgi:hypothetical protein
MTLNATATTDANGVLTITHNDHVTVVEPVRVWADGSAVYGSSADYCETCGEGLDYEEPTMPQPQGYGSTEDDLAQQLLDSHIALLHAIPTGHATARKAADALGYMRISVMAGDGVHEWKGVTMTRLEDALIATRNVDLTKALLAAYVIVATA